MNNRGRDNQARDDRQPQYERKLLVFRPGQARRDIDRQDLPRGAQHIDRIADLAEIDCGSGAQHARLVRRNTGQGQDQQPAGQDGDPVPTHQRSAERRHDRRRQGQQARARQGRPAIDQVEGAAVGEAGHDPQRAPFERRLGQAIAGDALKPDIEGGKEQRRRPRRQPRPVPQLPRCGGEDGEGQIGEPFGRDRPGRVVPARLASKAPGVDHQQIGQQRLPAEDAGVDRHARRRRRQPQGHDAEQGEQVQRIDPRDARPQEALVAEALLAERLEIDVTEDEARQDEEELDPQVALGGQGGHAADRQIGPHQIDHDPQGREEPERSQGTDVDRRRYGPRPHNSAQCKPGASFALFYAAALPGPLDGGRGGGAAGQGLIADLDLGGQGIGAVAHAVRAVRRRQGDGQVRPGLGLGGPAGDRALQARAGVGGLLLGPVDAGIGQAVRLDLHRPEGLGSQHAHRLIQIDARQGARLGLGGRGRLFSGLRAGGQDADPFGHAVAAAPGAAGDDPGLGRTARRRGLPPGAGQGRREAATAGDALRRSGRMPAHAVGRFVAPVCRHRRGRPRRHAPDDRARGCASDGSGRRLPPARQRKRGAEADGRRRGRAGGGGPGPRPVPARPLRPGGSRRLKP
uniref:PE-PGRS family protein n=1 Tax=Parastrongyloides trichosuri TaxID=131310 RepID=A0A0N4Z6D2_PARTI